MLLVHVLVHVPTMFPPSVFVAGVILCNTLSRLVALCTCLTCRCDTLQVGRKLEDHAKGLIAKPKPKNLKCTIRHVFFGRGHHDVRVSNLHGTRNGSQNHQLRTRNAILGSLLELQTAKIGVSSTISIRECRARSVPTVRMQCKILYGGNYLNPSFDLFSLVGCSITEFFTLLVH